MKKLYGIGALLALMLIATLSLQVALPSGTFSPLEENVVPGTDVNKLVSFKQGMGFAAGLRNDKVIAFDGNGVRWEFATDGAVNDMLATEERLLVGSDDRKLYVLGLEQGKELLRVDVGYRPTAIAADKEVHYMAVAGSLSALKNNLFLYDQNGKELYRTDPGAAVPFLYLNDSNANAIFITNNGEIHELNKSGQIERSVGLDYEPADAFFEQTTGSLYVADREGQVYRFDNELRLSWKVNTGSPLTSIVFSKEHDLLIAAVSDGTVIVLNGNGKELSRTKLPETVSQFSPSFEPDRFTYLSADNRVLSYSIEDMDQRAASARIQSILRYLGYAFAAALVLLVIFATPRVRKRVVSICSRLASVLYKHKISYLLLLPTLSLIAVFNYYPSFNGFLIAFMDYKPGAYKRWVGLDNFKTMIDNAYFLAGARNMFVFLVTDLLKSLIPAVIFAELIFALRSKFAQYWSRVMLYLPGILPGVAILLIWTDGILSSGGLINQLLDSVGLSSLSRSWLGDPNSAIWGLILIGFPWVGAYIIFYGALMGISSQLFEASKVDGCSWVRRVWSIDLPLIIPQLKFIFVVSFIGSIQDFGRIYLTTMGGPGHATYTPMLELYYNMTRFQNYGVASAMGISMFVVIFAATLVNMRIKSLD
ncbi:ABC transporter permease subunit [Paenibacillus cymbidii]|uniref:ABC transporter permease subunit n=1 Tax=Paenibacillus cymbidii TaxID=1639034 RepID=UPI001436AD79|nr:ABC transporter permease subunit [Paenibacillus cymbidii]